MAAVEKAAKPKEAPKAKAAVVEGEAEKPVRKTVRKAPAKPATTSADGGEA